MGLKELEEHPLRVLTVFRLPLVFIACYTIDLVVYVFIIRSAYPTYLQGFLTAPFSPNEDYTGNYPSPQVGAIYNVGVVTFIILFADIYFRLVRPSRWRISPSTVGFVVSIAASYVLSGIWWVSTGAPSAGTSIIGSSVILTLFVFSGRDFVHSARNKPPEGQKAPMPWGPTIFTVVSGVVYVAEYLNSSSLVPHLLGDAIFGILMALFIGLARRSPSGRNQIPAPMDVLSVHPDRLR